ncbi:uncharacterized protein [Triticum aestivum]|uniref:uncharacterized protein n=1 Tax=Triticum aestivum TaxID=4565 RepID=UPI001D01E2A7|nr:uncharacterized protein LOC123154173 [Triticum aestivum]
MRALAHLSATHPSHPRLSSPFLFLPSTPQCPATGRFGLRRELAGSKGAAPEKHRSGATPGQVDALNDLAAQAAHLHSENTRDPMLSTTSPGVGEARAAAGVHRGWRAVRCRGESYCSPGELLRAELGHEWHGAGAAGRGTQRGWRAVRGRSRAAAAPARRMRRGASVACGSCGAGRGARLHGCWLEARRMQVPGSCG